MQRIQTEYGGAVLEIAVAEGEEVSAGDLLLRFDASDVNSQIRETRLQKLFLLLEQERLTAVVEDRQPDFDAILSASPDAAAGLAASNVLKLPETTIQRAEKRELATYEAQRSATENQRQTIQRQMAEVDADLDAIGAEKPALERQLAVAREQVATQQDLVGRKLAPRPTLVAAIETEAGFDFQLSTLNGREAVLGVQLQQLTKQLEAVSLVQAAAAQNRIVEIEAAFLEIEEQIVRLLRRKAASELRAPVSGLIQSLPDTIVGRVIEAGGLVAEMVPQGVDLRFAAELAPRDVGFVLPGQKVRLKIDAYEFGRFGALDGSVVEVSPTTILNPQGVAHYEVLIDIPAPFFQGDPTRFRLLPGMTGEVDILTGSKTVFEYVWKPIYTNLDLALTER